MTNATTVKIVSANAKQVQRSSSDCDYRRLRALAGEIADKTPDVIAFEEIPTNPRKGTDVYDFINFLNYHARNRPDDNSIYVYVAGDWEVDSEIGGVGLIANITNVEPLVGELEKKLGFTVKDINPKTKQRRVAVFGKFKKAEQEFIAAATHYGTNIDWLVPFTPNYYSAWTAEQQNRATELINKVMSDIDPKNKLPKFIAGDFNMHPRKGHNWSSQYTALRFERKWRDSGELYDDLLQWSYKDPISHKVRIDYAWAKNAKPVKAGVLKNRKVKCGIFNRRASDHKPIWAEFKLKP